MTPRTIPPHRDDGEDVGQQPTCPLALFLAFSPLAWMGFGGVLPIAQPELMDRLRWLSPSEFSEWLCIGQVLPGPNIVNLALMVGDRAFGLRGALVAAVLGMGSVCCALAGWQLWRRQRAGPCMRRTPRFCWTCSCTAPSGRCWPWPSR